LFSFPDVRFYYAVCFACHTFIHFLQFSLPHSYTCLNGPFINKLTAINCHLLCATKNFNKTIIECTVLQKHNKQTPSDDLKLIAMLLHFALGFCGLDVFPS